MIARRLFDISTRPGTRTLHDRGDRATRQREWRAGLNFYHFGHNWKTRLNLLRHDFADRHETVFLIEHHLQF